MEEFVNFDDIRENAQALEKVGYNIQDNYEIVIKSINTLKNAWQGNAGSLFNDKLNELSKNIKLSYEEMFKSVLFLASVANGYENLTNDSAKKMISILGYGDYSMNPNRISNIVTKEEIVEEGKKEDIVVIEDEESVSKDNNTAEENVSVSKELVEEEKAEEKVNIENTNEDHSNNEIINDVKQNESNDSKDITDDSSNIEPILENNNVSYKSLTDKEIDEIAKDVIDGKYGNGKDRVKLLEENGYDYDLVQARVNEITRGSNVTSTTTGDIDIIARDVIDGKYGNGEQRRLNLEKAGYDYHIVQARVNEILGGR